MKYTKFVFILAAALAIGAGIAFATKPKPTQPNLPAGVTTIMADVKTIDVGAVGLHEETIEFTAGDWQVFTIKGAVSVYAVDKVEERIF
jgi:hypothetical protein